MVTAGDFKTAGDNMVIFPAMAARWAEIANSCIMGLNSLSDFMAENGCYCDFVTEETRDGDSEDTGIPGSACLSEDETM
jgi:hypothetical protein